jgi:hypothetical protein
MEPNEDHELSRVLRTWQIPDAPAELEDRVMSARRGPGAWQFGIGWRAKLVLAATNAALVVIGVFLSRVPVQPVKPPIVPAPVLSLDADGEAPFVPVPYTMPLDSYETGAVLRINVPVASLIGAGYRVSVADPGGIVVADVLVGDDGRAHAVRLVSGVGLQGRGE